MLRSTSGDDNKIKAELTEEQKKKERIQKNLENAVFDRLGIYGKPSQIRALFRSGKIGISSIGAVKILEKLPLFR